MIPRTVVDRRTGWERRGISAEEANCVQACRFAGAVFQGIQPGFAHIPAQCLFAASKDSTTLCLPADSITPLAIKNRLMDAVKAQQSVARKPAGFSATFPPINATSARTA
jgi:hypothetical protein